MLTRLKVNGFKNLVDVDVRFGPFTCIAGVNGSGKSNLFDAIRFLALLAEKPLIEAALSIRGPGGSYDIHSLFHRVGDQNANEMSFEAEMIIPPKGIDDLGQLVRATATFVRYSLKLIYQPRVNIQTVTIPEGIPLPSTPQLQIADEQLVSLSAVDASDLLGFARPPEWFESAVCGDEGEQIIRLQDGSIPQHERRLILRYDDAPRRELYYEVEALPRTVLSRVEFDQNQTAVMTQQEMRSWRVLHLDPAALRQTSYLSDRPTLLDSGYGFVKTLHAIANTPPNDERDPYEAETAVYARVAGAIWDLLGEVSETSVEPVNKRGELELTVTQRDGTTHSVRALSDGTLRFLALAVLAETEESALYCVEEPENGIHPGRIQALLKLLQAIAMDTSYPIEEGNPLRQVIVSTHSPSVVMRVPEDSLVMAELWPSHDHRGRFKRARFRGLGKTWRDPSPNNHSLALGTLLAYLNPEGYRPLPEPQPERDSDAEVRVMDRADLHDLLSPTPRVDG